MNFAAEFLSELIMDTTIPILTHKSIPKKGPSKTTIKKEIARIKTIEVKIPARRILVFSLLFRLINLIALIKRVIISPINTASPINPVL